MIGQLMEIIRILRDAGRRRRSWIFAYLIVPGSIISYLLSGLSPVSPLVSVEDSISVVQLRQVARPVSQPPEERLILILEPNELDFAIPWRDKSLKSLYASIDAKLYSLNRTRINFDPDRLQITLPLFGVSDPIVLMADGVPDNQIALLGRRVSMDSLRLASRQSAAYALWGVIWSTFGLGLVLNLGAIDKHGRKDGSREEGTDEDEQ